MSIIATNLKNDFTFCSNYFETLFSNSIEKFPQSIIFEGLDSYSQLFFALEMARISNCLEDKATDCNCLNCRWIKENKHPAINFISQNHFYSEGKTTIGIAQTKKIEKELLEHSDYHRFFIFFNSKDGEISDTQRESYEKYKPDGYKIYSENEFSVEHLNYKILAQEASNSLLKSIEEPPNRTTFVFLTKNKEDLISTIVSRSFVFKLPCAASKINHTKTSQFLSSYPDISPSQAISISDSILAKMKENDEKSNIILDEIMAFFIEQLKFEQKRATINKIKKDISYIAQAKKWAYSSISDKNIIETLFMKIARNSL